MYSYSHHEVVGKVSEKCRKTDEISLEAQFCENQTKNITTKNLKNSSSSSKPASTDSSSSSLNETHLLLYESLVQHFKLKANKKGKEQLKFEGTLEELQDFVKLVLDLEGTWKKGIKEKNLYLFQSKKSTVTLSWWSSTSTLTVAGKKEGDISRKIHCLMMLNDPQSLKSVPKPGGPGELLSDKFDILPPRNYNTDNSVDCETQNMAFIHQDETLPIIREENTTDPQIQKKLTRFGKNYIKLDRVWIILTTTW